MKQILILSLLLFFPLFAQEPEGWLIPFACAYEPDIAGFNTAFANKGLPQAKTRHFGWGMELRSLVSRNILFGPLYFRTWNDAENDSFHLRTENWGIFAELGLKLPIFKFLTFVPLVGIGGVQPSFQIRKRTGDMTLDSLLNAPFNIAHISPGMKITGLGALELNIILPTNTGSYGLSLRGGYLYSPFGLNWHLANGARITNTPDSKIKGPWLSLGLTIIPAPEVQSQ
ncbi:MAG: hypothetical protein ABIK47_05750 [candidate division WOR-3 bacterium]